MHVRLLRVRAETEKTGQGLRVALVVPELEVVIVQILAGSEGLANVAPSAMVQVLFRFRKMRVEATCDSGTRARQGNAILECGALVETLVLEDGDDAYVLRIRKERSGQVHDAVIGMN